MTKALMIARIVGAALLMGGVVASSIKFDTQLKFINGGSARDWAPPPETAFDHVMLQFPVKALLVSGMLLLLASFMASFIMRAKAH